MRKCLHENTERFKRKSSWAIRKQKRNKIKVKHENYLSSLPSVKLPEELCIDKETERNALLTAISQINSHIKTHNIVLLDFSHTKTIHATAMLLLNSHIRQIIDNNSTLKFKFRLPHNPKVKQVLKQIGLLDHINEKLRVNPTDHDVIHWKCVSGQYVNNELSAKLFTDDLEVHINDQLFAAFAEAMANSVEHAYEGIALTENTDKWWMFMQTKDNYMSVALCDLGIGIPESLTRKDASWKQRAIDAVGIEKIDKYLIEAAVQESKSRHRDKKERGKGLSQIVSAVNNYGKEAGFIIYSNHGCYKKFFGDKKADKLTTHNYKNSINGTIISWKVPIDRQAS